MALEVNGDNDYVLRAEIPPVVVANNNDIQLAAEADILLDAATFTSNTSDGNVTILADDSNTAAANVCDCSDAEAIASYG